MELKRVCERPRGEATSDRTLRQSSVVRKIKLLFSNKVTATLILRISRIAWDERGTRIFDIETQEKPLRAEIFDRSRCMPWAVFFIEVNKC